jgi:hypothetical protein
MTERPPPHKSLPCFVRNSFQTHWINDMKFEINDDVVLKLAGGGLVRHRDGPSPQPRLGEGPPVLFTTLGTSQIAMGCLGAHLFFRHAVPPSCPDIFRALRLIYH